MKKSCLLTVIVVLFTSLFANVNAGHAASITSASLYGFQCGTPPLLRIRVTGHFDTNDGYTDGTHLLDLFGARIVDGQGHELLTMTFGEPVGGTEFSPNLNYVIAAPSQNPIRIEVYEAVNYSGFGALLASNSFNSPCLSPAGIASSITFFNPGDSRVNPRPGNRLAVWCNTSAAPPNLVVYGAGDTSNNGGGFLLGQFTYTDLLNAGKQGITKSAGAGNGTISAMTDGKGDFYTAWNGGQFGANGHGDFTQTFTCIFTPPSKSCTFSPSGNTFIDTTYSLAQAAESATGVPASVTLAQAILESNYGKDTIGSANNFFGIKATTLADGTVNFGHIAVGWVEVPTQEFVGGKYITVNAKFRKYNSIADSFIDHANFFLENARYSSAMNDTGNPDEFARQIAQAGYATDPNYANSLIKLMKQYNLYQYDKLTC